MTLLEGLYLLIFLSLPEALIGVRIFKNGRMLPVLVVDVGIELQLNEYGRRNIITFYAVGGAALPVNAQGIAPQGCLRQFAYTACFECTIARQFQVIGAGGGGGGVTGERADS
jgi:hypothetical protein